MSKVAVIGDNCSGSRYCDASRHCPDKAFRLRGKWVIPPSVCKAEEGCDKCVIHCRHNAISIEEAKKKEPIISVDPDKCRIYDETATKCPKGNGEPACDVWASEGCNRGVLIQYVDGKNVIDLTGCDDCHCGSMTTEPKCVPRCPYGAITWKGSDMQEKDPEEVTGTVVKTWQDSGEPRRALIKRQDGSHMICKLSQRKEGSHHDHWEYEKEAPELCMVLGCNNEADPNLFLPLHEGKPDFTKKITGPACKECFREYSQGYVNERLKQLEDQKKKKKGPITSINIHMDDELIPPYSKKEPKQPVRDLFHITTVDHAGKVEVTFVNHDRKPIHVHGKLTIQYTYASTRIAHMKNVLSGYGSIIVQVLRPIALAFLPERKREERKG